MATLAAGVAIQPLRQWDILVQPGDVAALAGPRPADCGSQPAGRLGEPDAAVKRAGRPVLYEPFIVTELAAVGRWDETALVAAFRQQEFAFVITLGNGPDGRPAAKPRGRCRLCVPVYPVAAPAGGGPLDPDAATRTLRRAEWRQGRGSYPSPSIACGTARTWDGGVTASAAVHLMRPGVPQASHTACHSEWMVPHCRHRPTRSRQGGRYPAQRLLRGCGIAIQIGPGQPAGHTGDGPTGRRCGPSPDGAALPR